MLLTGVCGTTSAVPYIPTVLYANVYSMYVYHHTVYRSNLMCVEKPQVMIPASSPVAALLGEIESRVRDSYPRAAGPVHELPSSKQVS